MVGLMTTLLCHFWMQQVSTQPSHAARYTLRQPAPVLVQEQPSTMIPNGQVPPFAMMPGTQQQLPFVPKMPSAAPQMYPNLPMGQQVPTGIGLGFCKPGAGPFTITGLDEGVSCLCTSKPP